MWKRWNYGKFHKILWKFEEIYGFPKYHKGLPRNTVVFWKCSLYLKWQYNSRAIVLTFQFFLNNGEIGKLLLSYYFTHINKIQIPFLGFHLTVLCNQTPKLPHDPSWIFPGMAAEDDIAIIITARPDLGELDLGSHVSLANSNLSNKLFFGIRVIWQEDNTFEINALNTNNKFIIKASIHFTAFFLKKRESKGAVIKTSIIIPPRYHLIIQTSKITISPLNTQQVELLVSVCLAKFPLLTQWAIKDYILLYFAIKKIHLIFLTCVLYSAIYIYILHKINRNHSCSMTI